MRRKKISFALWIPVVLIAIIAFSTKLTHLMFWFNANNDFQRGVLSFAPHILSGLYMLALVFLTIKIHHSISIGEVFIVFYIAIICAGATAIESTMSKKFILPGAMIISCSMYYMFLFVQTHKRDLLTGIFNRSSFYSDAESLRKSSTSIISMDMNGLKEINDTHGHKAGDEALKEFANVLTITSGKSFKVYRTGGDEFMALGKNTTEEQVQKFITETRNLLQKSSLMVSFGYAHYSTQNSFDDICNLADEKMYEDKRKYKHRETTR